MLQSYYIATKVRFELPSLNILTKPNSALLWYIALQASEFHFSKWFLGRWLKIIHLWNVWFWKNEIMFSDFWHFRSRERSVPPHFLDEGTFEYDVAMKWKMQFEFEQRQKEHLELQLRESRERLELEVEDMYKNHKAWALREGEWCLLDSFSSFFHKLIWRSFGICVWRASQSSFSLLALFSFLIGEKKDLWHNE